jgi:MOSC domain-containing protein YiiM
VPVLTRLLIADGPDFVTRDIDRAELVFGGLAGDLHAGLTRPACSRTPWHKRETTIANTRQLSLVSVEECAEVARRLDLPGVEPALLGANLVVEGVDDFSAVEPATRLLVPSGATIFITEENGPCIQPGHKLAKAFGRKSLVFDFVRAATHRRGLLGIVEREGPIAAGDSFKVVPSPTRRS